MGVCRRDSLPSGDDDSRALRAAVLPAPYQEQYETGVAAAPVLVGISALYLVVGPFWALREDVYWCLSYWGGYGFGIEFELDFVFYFQLQLDFFGLGFKFEFE